MSTAGRYKTWIIALFLIPIGIYLFYFILGSREAREAGQTGQVPQTYLEAGTPAKIDGGTYRAGSAGYKIAFYDNLKAGNNTMMPEPGFIFAVVPVLQPSPGEGGQPARSWVLIEDSGRVYRPLSTSTDRLSNLKRMEDREILPSTAPDYLVFKVSIDARTFYLKLSSGQTTLYWRLPGPAQ